MMAGDPYKSGIVAVGDQVSGHIAGYMACAILRSATTGVSVPEAEIASQAKP